MLIATACNSHKITSESGEDCSIYPDYQDVTIPYNIAPLNFSIDSIESGFVEFLSSTTEKPLYVKIKDGKISIPMRKWRHLMNDTKGGKVVVTVVDKSGTAYNSFLFYVAEEPIDRYAVYRLMEPLYRRWSEVGLYQRDLESFKQYAVIENRNFDYACMNCHSFASQDPDNMLFHLRTTEYSGTYLRKDGGEFERLNTKTPQTISNLTYPSWHPGHKYIAFSVDDVKFALFQSGADKMEVFDGAADIVVYNTETHEITTSPLLFSKARMETFPSFTPDGKKLIFCSADSVAYQYAYTHRHYLLCSIDFDPETGEFGDKIDTLYDPRPLQRSVSIPRVSPDGRYILFSQMRYGYMPIFYRTSNLLLYDFEREKVITASPWNSIWAEGYHSWSSNSRWVLFSSRRDDNLYSRLYIGYIGEDGELGKAFMIPQADPEQNQKFMKSYSVPEMVTKRIGNISNEVRGVGKATQVTFASEIDETMTDATMWDAISGASSSLAQ